MRSLKFAKKAKKSIETLFKRSPEIARLIGTQIENLRKNPLPNNSKKLVGYSFFRCRVGSYRIIYEFDDEFLYIVVVGKRDQVYRDVRKTHSK